MATPLNKVRLLEGSDYETTTTTSDKRRRLRLLSVSSSLALNLSLLRSPCAGVRRQPLDWLRAQEIAVVAQSLLTRNSEIGARKTLAIG